MQLVLMGSTLFSDLAGDRYCVTSTGSMSSTAYRTEQNKVVLYCLVSDRLFSQRRMIIMPFK